MPLPLTVRGDIMSKLYLVVGEAILHRPPLHSGVPDVPPAPTGSWPVHVDIKLL